MDASLKKLKSCSGLQQKEKSALPDTVWIVSLLKRRIQARQDMEKVTDSAEKVK